MTERERISPHPGDSRFGQFKAQDDVGRSLKQDRAKEAKTGVKSGQGDRGDQRRR